MANTVQQKWHPTDTNGSELRLNLMSEQVVKAWIDENRWFLSWAKCQSSHKIGLGIRRGHDERGEVELMGGSGGRAEELWVPGSPYIFSSWKHLRGNMTRKPVSQGVKGNLTSKSHIESCMWSPLRWSLKRRLLWVVCLPVAMSELSAPTWSLELRRSNCKSILPQRFSDNVTQDLTRHTGLISRNRVGWKLKRLRTLDLEEK